MFALLLPFDFTWLTWRHPGRTNLIHGNRNVGNSLVSPKIARLLLKGLSVVYVCVGSTLSMGVAQAGTLLVTNNLINEGSQAQTNVAVTFGQIFKAGDVPAGDTLSATLGGQPIQVQVDAKATNPDGSLRHAVLTALVPSISSNYTEPLALSSASPASTGAAVTLAQLLATSFDATADINIGGTDYTVSAKQLLQAKQASCAPYNTACNIWLQGPLVSEWIVGGPVTSAGGVANPNLQVYFDVRAYAGNPITRVRVNVIIENDWAYSSQQILTYNATLTSGNGTGSSYTFSSLQQYPYTRWHQVLWWNGSDPDLYVQQDTQYIQSTGAVSRYEVLQPDNAFLNSVIQTCAPLQRCDQTKMMSTTGAQPSIGPLPRWTTTYIIDPDYRSYNWMLADDDAIGAYSSHYRDQATGRPLSIINHPYVTIADWGYANSVAAQNPNTWGKDLLPQCAGCGTAFYNTNNPNVFENAHHPSVAVVSYMVTGSYYYLEEMQFTASMIELWANPGYRGYSNGTLDKADDQPRGKAWSMRSIGDAAYLTPDSDPMKTYFTTMITNIIANFNQDYTNDTTNLLHIVTNYAYSLNGGTNNAMSPWQDDFFTWSASHMSEEGWPGASQLRDWAAQFQIWLMTDWQNNPTQGYCWLEASAYDLQVLDSSGNMIPNLTSVYGTNFPTLVGLTCNSQAMITAMGNLEGKPWQIGEMHGYAYSPTGFPANLQIGLAAAADSSLPSAQQAWLTFQSRSIQSDYSDYPNFSVLPRFLPAATTVNFFASPNPVLAGHATTLYWNSSNATSCSAMWTSSTAPSGNVSIGPISGPTSYSINCTGPNGVNHQSVTVSLASSTTTTAPPPASSTPTPTPTPDPAPATKGGGGTSWLGLLFLMGLVGLSRRRRH